MSLRAEMRRKKRENDDDKVVYTLTKAQLNTAINEAVKKKMTEIKEEATGDAINAAMVLLLTLPMEVLMDHYWPKTYAQKLPGFINKVLEYYEDWQDGKIKMEDLQQDLWEYGGIRLEDGGRSW